MRQTKKGFIIGAVIGLVWCLLVLYILMPATRQFSTQNPVIGISLMILSLPRYTLFVVLGPLGFLSGPQGGNGPDLSISAFGDILNIILSIIVFGLIGALIGRMIKKKEFGN